MTIFRAIFAISFVGILAGVAQADQTDALLQDGSYEVKVRLELPNVVNWAAQKIATICVPNAEGTHDLPLPILSDNNPLAMCPARNVRRDGAVLSFDIECAGRDGARARAVYTLLPGGFKGRVAMVMGGKNMTMTEVQAGRRVGSCDPASAPQN
jgi:hypothetical protein